MLETESKVLRTDWRPARENIISCIAQTYSLARMELTRCGKPTCVFFQWTPSAPYPIVHIGELSYSDPVYDEYRKCQRVVIVGMCVEHGKNPWEELTKQHWMPVDETIAMIAATMEE